MAAERPGDRVDKEAYVKAVTEAMAAIAREQEEFTEAEVELIDATFLLLRSRTGETALPDPRAAVRSCVRDALAAMDAEDRQTAGARQSTAEGSSSPTRPRTPVTG